jgi:hypothetical protein
MALVLVAGTMATITSPGAVPASGQDALTFNPVWSVGPLDDTDAPVAESSPNVATLDAGSPAVVVGDRSGHLYAYHLSDGSAVPGWPVAAGDPIDSTPSVAVLGGRYDSVFAGVGDAIEPQRGGYEAWGPAGNRLWVSVPSNPPGDASPSSGVQASLPVGALQTRTDVVAGSLGQQAYALSAANGRTLPGWPFYASDSNFSTAVIADLYGTGQREVVEGGDQTAGYALGQAYPQGGHLRVLNSSGGLVCDYHTTQTVDSSPAVGPFLAGGNTGIVVGTGAFFPRASDTNKVMAFNPDCQLQWSDRLDGSTFSSPGLADVLGNGRLDVVEGTDRGDQGGSVWVLDGASGRPIWAAPVVGRVIGSVTTADLTGHGYQDLLVPTVHGVEVLDGRSGAQIAVLGSQIGFQNAPLVTADPNGDVGITIAGYIGSPAGQTWGVIEHYQIPGSNGALAVGAGSWPEFHHDRGLSGTVGPLTRPWPACVVPSAARAGYDLVARDGGVFAFGQPFCGSTGGRRLNAPIVAAAVASDRGGYWLAAADGGVFAFGGASFYGSLGATSLNQPIVGMAATPDGGGYWLVGADGGVFTFGDAGFYGSTGNLLLVAPIVGMAANSDGRGYRLVAADGGVFAFGDAGFYGSTGNLRLARPVVGIATENTTGGYWLVAADGGIFSFSAPFYGSTGKIRLARPIVGMERTADGRGYRLVASDGGVFAFGDAGFLGSMGGRRLNQPVVAAAGS